jgi:general secretion pathway protein N
MIERLALLLLLGGCLIFGAILLVELEPAGTEDAAGAKVAARPDTPPTIRRRQNPRIDELLAATLARPLFSSTRRPPQSASNEAATDSDLADTRLTGIVTEPGRRTAIFAVNGDKPLKVAEGEAVSGWRIESITPREVSLSGPSGTKTLQPKMDPNLAPPPGQPATGSAGGRPPNPAAGAGGRPPTPPAAGAGPRPPVPTVAGVGPPNRAVPISTPGEPPRPARLRQQR